MLSTKKVEIIGNQIAIEWADGSQSFYSSNHLRKYSPSAENIGEKDIFGNIYPGTHKSSDNAQVLGFDYIGNYALRFIFDDGHTTGIYSFDYLKSLDF